jgi:hypothetical protein
MAAIPTVLGIIQESDLRRQLLRIAFLEERLKGIRE